MGIKSLNTLIKNHTNNGEKKYHLSKFKGMKFAIDTNLYLYKYLYGKKNHINGIFFMINKLKKFNITPIFIFDGKPPEEKNSKIIERKYIKTKLQKRLQELKMNLDDDSLENEIVADIHDKISNIEKRILYVDKDIIEKTMKLFDLMGIAYICADCEAEHYCSKLSMLNLVDGVISEDTDTLACGSKLIIRQFSNKDDSVNCYNLDEILYDLDLSYTSFVDVCILLGNDYNNRPKGLTIDSIYTLIKKHKSIEKLIELDLISVNFNYKAIRNIINLNDIQPNFIKLACQLSKKSDIFGLENFLKNNSTIEEKTFKHRINLIYNKNKSNYPISFQKF